MIETKEVMEAIDHLEAVYSQVILVKKTESNCLDLIRQAITQRDDELKVYERALKTACNKMVINSSKSTINGWVPYTITYESEDWLRKARAELEMEKERKDV